jgi:hypothetical protein
VNNAMEGVPLISAGQELGLRGTVVPPHDSSAAEGPPFGYERYFAPFDPNKMIPQFMTFNSMMPLWRALQSNQTDTGALLALYSAIANARKSSPALRSSNRVFLNLENNTPDEQIFSVAKFERQNANPATSDVVFAFVNLQVGQEVQTPEGNAFSVNVDDDHDGLNDFGIKPDRLYNVKTWERPAKEWNLCSFESCAPGLKWLGIESLGASIPEAVRCDQRFIGNQ